ncbi:uncharacterized protein CDV56_102237 [Aspergillus thermomutatus]|uniref:Single-strand DNA deaminase toxin A-like C-terminal domain-containing protein n=1 Tax=Aspergillus thermomutatus TaxID=41047 RepID=A0A397G618_ASPTH|nr:uncharacterized protein CDV56_102237 [Aspergillus thermomutatus]RHZ44343.1 hypothetical protein CDV56_102237 [Aspergillus thermomutatus]
MSRARIIDIDVLHWNASSVYVRCPFCERVHRHGFVDYEPGLRFSHCGNRASSYRFYFPIDQQTGEVAYEIDKRNARFVNVCQLGDLKDASDDDELLEQQLMRANISDEWGANMVIAAREYLTIRVPDGESFRTKRILFAISNCVNGRANAVKKFLDKSPDAAFFLQGKYTDGQTMLILASMEQSPDMGRLDNVKLLLANGANKYLRDFDNRRAVDMAQPIARNLEERDTRAPWYKEAAALRDRERREIASILDDSLTWRRTVKAIAVLERGCGFPQIAAMSGWSHERSPVHLNGQVWTDKVMHLASGIGHTLAPIANRDHGKPGRFHASHAEKHLMAYFVDRHVFLPEDTGPDEGIEDEIGRLSLQIEAKIDSCATVRRFFETQQRKENLEQELFVAHEPMPGDDGDIEDVELVQRLKQDISHAKEELRHLEAHPEVGGVRLLQRKLRSAEKMERVHNRLLPLSERAPPIALKSAVILISAPSEEICKDCQMFRDRLNETFGLSIELAERTI